MPNLIPPNFRELLSAFLFLIGIIFSFLSLDGVKKDHSLRLTGVFVLSATALFSNNDWCYFAAIFIVATAVTQLDFLQNLAAIIRGSKEYFEYKKEFLTPKEIEESTAKEANEIEETVDKQSSMQLQAGDDLDIHLDRSNLTFQRFAMICEEYAFRYIERKYEKPIQRHIRFRGKGIHAEFDGIMQMDDHDIVFELQVSRSSRFPVHFIQRIADRMTERVKAYTLLTNRKTKLSLIFIGDFPPKIINQIQDCFKNLNASQKDIALTHEIFSLKEIGLENFPHLENSGHSTVS